MGEPFDPQISGLRVVIKHLEEVLDRLQQEAIAWETEAKMAVIDEALEARLIKHKKKLRELEARQG